MPKLGKQRRKILLEQIQSTMAKHIGHKFYYFDKSLAGTVEKVVDLGKDDFSESVKIKFKEEPFATGYIDCYYECECGSKG